MGVMGERARRRETGMEKIKYNFNFFIINKEESETMSNTKEMSDTSGVCGREV